MKVHIDKHNISIDPEQYPQVGNMKPEYLTETIIRILHMNGWELTEKNIYSVIAQLESDLDQMRD